MKYTTTEPTSRWHRRRGAASIETVVIICGVLCVVFGIANVIANLTERSFAAVHSESNAVDVRPGTVEVANAVQEKPTSNPAYYLGAVFFVALVVCPTGVFLIFIRRQIARLEDIVDQTSVVEEPAAPAATPKRPASLTNVLSKRNEILARLEGSWEVIMEGHAVVSTYMSRDLFSVPPDMSPDDAMKQLQAKGFRRCMVTDQEGHLLGVVSKKDILSKNGRQVQDVMTDRPRLAMPDMEIHIALSVLLENRISCLPVVENCRLVGVISTSDLLMVLQCLLLELSIIGRRDRAEKQPDESPCFIGAPVHLAKSFPTGDHFQT